MKVVEINLENFSGIVTGGASGLGKAIVKKILEAGADVIIADINEQEAEKALKEFEEFKNKIEFIKTDVSKKDYVENLVKKTIEKFKKIDYLVNNAGILIPRLLVDPQGKEEITEEIFDKIVNINQKGCFLCAQAVAREMIKNKKGVIINVSSESGLEGSEGQSVYAATKAAIYSFTRSWAKELGKYNIRVVGVAPGVLEPTALRSFEYERALAYTRGITVEELRKSYEKLAIPLKRVGKLEEVANLVCFLISDLASYISGTTINISGGKTR
ncbi:MAG: SDR family oxidoreductase [Candidatus Omnitrophica bacterium]|nr:SDR family oxidoreductase [Candidatus Omnitrophota bacterium]MCM8802936.1 SDR family oxidoreductase [Candidatus Omnitrophota bacterium]